MTQKAVVGRSVEDISSLCELELENYPSQFANFKEAMRIIPRAVWEGWKQQPLYGIGAVGCLALAGATGILYPTIIGPLGSVMAGLELGIREKESELYQEAYMTNYRTAIEYGGGACSIYFKPSSELENYTKFHLEKLKINV